MNVFELFGTIAINNKGALSALKDTTERAAKAGKQMQEAFKKVGSATLKVGKVVGTAAAAVGSAWAATVESTRDYRGEMAKLDTAFTTNGHSAETATKTYKALQAVLGETDQAVEAANHLAVMCDTEEELANWTDICTGVYAQFGDSLPIEGLTEAANETAKVGVVTGGLADALNWAGISEDDFNLKLKTCRNEQERQKLIMDTLLPTYKAQAESYKKNAESIMKANTAQDNMNRAMAKIGEIGEPIFTGLKNWIADMVNAAAPHLQTLVDKLVNFDDTMTNEVWPWIQKESKAIFGVDVPDWPTVKSNLSQSWENAKADFAGLVKLLPEFGDPDTGSLVDQITNWWKGQGDNAYEQVKSVLTWTFGTFIAPTLEKVDEWWNGEGGGEDKLLGLLCWTLGEFITPAIADIVTTTGGTIAGWASDFITGLVDLLDWGLGELGLPTVTDVVNQINAWWADVVSNLKLTFSALFEVNQTVSAARETAGSWETPYVPVGEYDNGWGNDYDTGADFSGAIGIDRVPRDGYLIRAHKDETLLNKVQADQWRGGGFDVDALASRFASSVATAMAGMAISFDKGATVGQLLPAIDAGLGTISNRKGRRN